MMMIIVLVGMMSLRMIIINSRVVMRVLEGEVAVDIRRRLHHRMVGTSIQVDLEKVVQEVQGRDTEVELRHEEDEN